MVDPDYILQDDILLDESSTLGGKYAIPFIAVLIKIHILGDPPEISETALFNEESTEDGYYPDDLLIVHMDIRHPLRKLQGILEKRTGSSLDDFSFWLQDAQLVVF